MPVVHISDPADPRVADYRFVQEPAALKARGLFVAEGRTVVTRLLGRSRFAARSILMSDRARAALSIHLAALPDGLQIYQTSRDVVSRIIGYDIHQACLALGERTSRSDPFTIRGLPAGRQLVVGAEGVADPDNLGSLFRNAWAFGAACVLLSPDCCDPLYRKTIRTSMAASLHVPFVTLPNWPADLAQLRRAGFYTVALTPNRSASDIRTFWSGATRPPRLAVLIGGENTGLAASTLALADARVRIPMAEGVDSLNLATAAGIAMHTFWEREVDRE